jgi:plastocyanin
VRRLLLAGALVLALAGCRGGPGGSIAPDAEPVTGVTEVTMKSLRFEPPVIQVPAGTTVTWRFTDGNVPHNVSGPGFKSEPRSSGTFTHAFPAAGTFDYRCELHPGMNGRVVVSG